MSNKTTNYWYDMAGDRGIVETFYADGDFFIKTYKYVDGVWRDIIRTTNAQFEDARWLTIRREVSRKEVGLAIASHQPPQKKWAFSIPCRATLYYELEVHAPSYLKALDRAKEICDSRLLPEDWIGDDAIITTSELECTEILDSVNEWGI